MFEPCGTGDNYRKAGNRMKERGQTRLVMNKAGQTGPAPERLPPECRAATVQKRDLVSALCE